MIKPNKSLIVIIFISAIAIVASLILCLNNLLKTGENGGTPEEPPTKKGEIPNEIVVDSPLINQAVNSPLVIHGQARGFWFFEASFPIEIYDNNDFLLGQTVAQAQGEWMTENFIPFEAEIRFSAPSTARGILVLAKDNPSGLPENEKELRIPIVFETGQGTLTEKMTVKIFLSDSKYAQEPYFDCSRTVAVGRKVLKSVAVAKAALEALLRGPTQEEIEKGYITTINSGVRVKKITIENGIARADFDEQLEFGVGGSCRVAAIRAQIINTLKQFPNIKGAVISINGRTEDILQP